MSQAKICWELLTEQSLLYWPLLIKTDTLIKTSPIIFVLWYRFINLDRLNSFSCSSQSKEYFYDLETWCLVYGRRHLRKDGDFCWFLQLPAEIFYWPSFSGVKVTSELWKVSNWQMLSKRCKYIQGGGQLQVGGWLRGGECQQRDRVDLHNRADHAVHLLATRRLY